MSPKNLSRLHKLIWALIYGGLFVFVTGLAVGEAALAWCLRIAGGVLVAAGALLVWVRSRIGD